MRTIAQAKQTARGILAIGTALVALFVTLPMVGCGGGSKSSGGSSVTKARGGFTFGVQWPDKTRVIPLAANSIKVTLVRTVPGPTVQPVPVVPLLTPPAGPPRTSTVTVSNLELGTYRITATAYPNADGTGTPLATATVDEPVTPGNNTALTMVLDATVARITVTPATGPNLKIGRTRQFTATAFDASDNIVLVHDNGPNRAILWESLNEGIVTIDADGLATMTGLGTAQIRATYVEPGITPGQQGTGATALATVNVVEVGLEDSSWPKFHGNAQNTGLATQGGPNNGVEQWQFALDNSIVFSSPAVAENGVVYVGAYDNNLYAINPDGSEKWRFPTGDVIESSPAISKDGVVYVGSMDHFVYALDGETKEVLWKRDLGAPVFASPAIGPDGTLYIGTTDPGVTMFALDSLNGDIVWEKDLGGGIQTCAAFNQNNTVLYVGALDGNLYALRATDGQQLWEFPAGDSVFSSSPAVAPNGNIYIGSLDGTLYAATPNGAAVPGFTPVVTGLTIFSSPAIGLDGTIYFGTFDNITGLDDNDVYAVDGATGTVKWTFEVGGGITSSPAIGADGIIYIGSYDGNLYALNPTGADVDRKKWEFLVGENIDSSPAIGLDGTVYIGGFNGRLFAVK